ncbi:MAG: hypothetical protein AB7S38_40485 [Vulcanimicrobiota bacterium]
MHNASVLNPWVDLPVSSPYELVGDRQMVKKHNESAGEQYQLETTIPPQPFLGDPFRASLILLSRAPGFDEQDDVLYSWGVVAQALRANLLHQPSALRPFYVLDPNLAGSSTQKRWLRQLRPLIRALKKSGVENPVDLISRQVAVIEWFPYRARRFKMPPAASEGQLYSWVLARRALEDPYQIVIVLGAKKQWEQSIGELGVPTLSSREPVLGPKQLGEVRFDSIVGHLIRAEQALLNTVADRLAWTKTQPIEEGFLRYPSRIEGVTYGIGFCGRSEPKRALVELHMSRDVELFDWLKARVSQRLLNGVKLSWERMDDRPDAGRRNCRVAMYRSIDFTETQRVVEALVSDAIALRGLLGPHLRRHESAVEPSRMV